VWTANTADEIASYERLRGAPLDLSKLEPLTAEMYEYSLEVSATEYLHALDYVRRYARRVVPFWNDYDVLVTPTLAKPPVGIGELDPAPGEPAMTALTNSGTFLPFTPPFNATGQPAISLPTHWTDTGLPVGVQLVGRPAGEFELLSVAGQIERAQPWADRRPGGPGA
jgi:amidase